MVILTPTFLLDKILIPQPFNYAPPMSAVMAAFVVPSAMALIVFWAASLFRISLSPSLAPLTELVRNALASRSARLNPLGDSLAFSS